MAHQKFSYYINKLEDKLVEVENNMEKYAAYFNSWNGKEGKNVFCRHTTLTLRVMFWLIVSRIVTTLPVALSEFFMQLGLKAPLKSSFSMKRRLIGSDFFSMMNAELVREFYKGGDVRKWHDYVLLSCDGSRLALPDVEELGELFGLYHSSRGEELYPTAKACVFQDTLNNITVKATVETKDTDERLSFESYFRDASALTGAETIMLLDRGYFSYLTIYKMIKNRQKFVMKARSAPWRTEFIDSGKPQRTVRITPSRATAVYRNDDWRNEPEKELTVRLVRFDHPDGSVDVLITNLWATDGVSCTDVVELYRLRWPVETAYGIYKNDEALELFSSFRIDGVLQDFHGAVILFNLASLMARETERIKENPGIKPDMNVVIGLMHNLCPALAGDPESPRLRKRMKIIAGEALYYGTYIRPNRSYPRIRRMRKTSGKFFRHTNYSMAI